MATLKLELKLRHPSNINGITLDPRPMWSLSDLVEELNSLEMKIDSSNAPQFTKTPPREFPHKKEVTRSSKAFVMHVSDDEESETEDEENRNPNVVVGKRFFCEDMYLSDCESSEDELVLEEPRGHLMDSGGLLESLLSEREFEHQQWVEEETRHKIALLEMDLLNESEKSASALLQLEKLTEARREMDRKIDTQYRRKIAEGLDNHLIALQRNHEQRSQIEERKIRSDAALEEAKRKDKALHEAKLRQEKARAEAEIQEMKSKEAHKEALEVERRISNEATEKNTTEITPVSTQNAVRNTVDSKETKDKATTMTRVSEKARKIEEERLENYDQLVQKNESLRSSSSNDFRQYELQIGRFIRQIPGSSETVRTKANELIKVINNPQCPQSISIAAFAKKIVFQSESLNLQDSTAFACGHVMVLVTSQVPAAMDILLAEFNKVCIYTVPKYILKSGLDKEAHLKLLGYQEENGKLETREHYLGRVESCMKLYAALVQTQTEARNPHGLQEGWAWLARVLNTLPANIYTAVALNAFLKIAGFALFRRYKSQFRKILNVVKEKFVTALEAAEDPGVNPVVVNIRNYIETNQFMKEPEGWRLQTELLSGRGVVDNFYGYGGYHRQNDYYDQEDYYY